MNLNKYTAFLKVVECGSVTKAAATMGHTQSGVTQLLNSLEKELGIQLLSRNRQGIQLTTGGQKILPYIKEVVKANHQLEDVVQHIRHKEENLIRIGTFTSVAVNWLPDIIREYQKIAPQVHFDLINCGYNNIEEELTKQQMDFGFVPLPLSLPCKCIEVYKDPLLAVFPLHHPKANSDYCPLSVFTQEPVISLIPAINRDADTVFENNHIIPNIKYTVEDDYAMLAMVEKDLGICIMPELLLQKNAHKCKAIELMPPAFRTIGIAFPSYETVKESAIQFAEFTANWIQEHFNDRIDESLNKGM